MDELPPTSLIDNPTQPTGPRNSWTCKDLDAMQADPDIALMVTSHCHPRKPVIARYFGDGMLEVECKHCHAFITRIAIAHDDIAELNPKLELRCGDPDCKDPVEDHDLIFRCKLHLKAGLFLAYHNKLAVLMCCKCKQLVYELNVKEASVQA